MHFRHLIPESLLAVALLSAMPASASPLPDPDFIAKVDRLMQWIAEQTNLEVPDHQPAFLFVPVDTINYVAVGSVYSGINPIEASFSPTDAGLILLPIEGFTDDVLVHELVHFMQMTSGKRVSCNGDLEHQAYDLQAQFHEETGIGEPVPPMTRIIATMCPPPWEESGDTFYPIAAGGEDKE
jgi:hypothetical protein